MSCRLHAVAGLYPRLSLTATAGSESNYLDRILASDTGIWELAAETEEHFNPGKRKMDIFCNDRLPTVVRYDAINLEGK